MMPDEDLKSRFQIFENGKQYVKVIRPEPRG